MGEKAENEEYICPNCGSVADGNYCPQCGQKTHLPEDTFWRMIARFVGQYFNYDSKMWRTLKTLLFYPGKLTLEYRAKRRQRYIPPISLYMFVTIVFFLILSIADSGSSSNNTAAATPYQDSVAAQHYTDSADASLAKQNIKVNVKREKRILAFRHWLKAHRRKSGEALNMDMEHNFPKIFFLMIPVLALLLKICFAKDKNYYFVDHAVFAMHVHSFAFIIILFAIINPFEKADNAVSNAILLMGSLYFILALRKVYHTKWLRSIFILLFVAFGYIIFLGVIFLLVVVGTAIT